MGGQNSGGDVADTPAVRAGYTCAVRALTGGSSPCEVRGKEGPGSLPLSPPGVSQVQPAAAGRGAAAWVPSSECTCTTGSPAACSWGGALEKWVACLGAPQAAGPVQPPFPCGAGPTPPECRLAPQELPRSPGQGWPEGPGSVQPPVRRRAGASLPSVLQLSGPCALSPGRPQCHGPLPSSAWFGPCRWYVCPTLLF